jgi:hypothetical protein
MAIAYVAIVVVSDIPNVIYQRAGNLEFGQHTAPCYGRPPTEYTARSSWDTSSL